MGAKWKYITTTTRLLEELVVAEFEKDTEKWNYDTDSEGRKIRKENFPKDTAYPYTMRFNERDDNHKTTEDAYEVDNDNEFNEAIIIEGKWLGYEMTNRILMMYAQPRYKCTTEIPRPTTTTFNRGELIKIVAPSYNLDSDNDKVLRTQRVSHKFWNISVEMEEDEETALL